MILRSNNVNIPQNVSFETLFSHYGRGLVIYANEFLRDIYAAEDVVHDVFVSIWEKMDSLSVETAKAYLFKATRNRCLDHLSRLKVRMKYQDVILNDPDLATSLDIDYYVESELRALIEKAISQLPQQQRLAFTKSRLEGKSLNEIAAEMNISSRTVEKHIELASKNLHNCLSPYMPLIILFGLLEAYNLLPKL